MKHEIKLVEKSHNEETFDIDHIYEYKFSLHCELEKNELMYGFVEDFIEIMKEEFEITLREYLKKSEDGLES